MSAHTLTISPERGSKILISATEMLKDVRATSISSKTNLPVPEPMLMAFGNLILESATAKCAVAMSLTST